MSALPASTARWLAFAVGFLLGGLAGWFLATNQRSTRVLVEEQWRTVRVKEPNKTAPLPVSVKRRSKAVPVRFKLDGNFHSSLQPWRPVANLSIRGDAKEGLELSEGEYRDMKAAFDQLISRSSKIQSEDSIVTDGKPGEQLVYLEPVPSKWSGVQSEFETALGQAIGEAKAQFFLESARNEINLITGNYGTMPRGLYIRDLASLKVDAPPGEAERIPDWTVRIDSGSAVAGDFSLYFPKEMREMFYKDTTYQAGWTAMFSFRGDPPEFLKPLFDKAP